MKMDVLVFVVLCIVTSNNYLQVHCVGMTTAASTDGTVLYECDLKNVTKCNMEVRAASVLHWSVTQFNRSPPIRDKSDPREGLFLIFHSWTFDNGVYTSVASTPEVQLPTGKGTLSFNYYIWDLNEPLQSEFPKLKVFSCGNETRAIWKRTGDKVDRWITANIYLSCREPFKISFEGTVNGSKCGLAIDDIVIQNGHVSTPGPTTKSPASSTRQVPLVITGLYQPNNLTTGISQHDGSVKTTVIPVLNQGSDDHLVPILIGIIVALIFFIVISVSIHCCWHRRTQKTEMESAVDADAKRKRFQQSKSGLMTTSGYMTLTKPKPFTSTELGPIDLTSTSRLQQGPSSRLQHGKTVVTRGKSLPRLPSLPEEAKQQQQQRHSLNMDATYEYVDELPELSSSRNSQIDQSVGLTTKNGSIENTLEDRRDAASPPVYFTLSPSDPAYSHLSEYGTMPDVVMNADDNGLVHKPSLAAKSSPRRKSSLSSLREKLSKGLSNASNDYDELKHDEEYYEVVNVECQL